MNPYATGIIGSIVVYILIGNYVGSRVKHLDDYFVAGRNAPTPLIVGTLVASFLSTNAFLGETGFAYSGYGSLILIMTAVNSLGYVLGAVYFGRYLRRGRALTVAEYFGQRFNSERVRMAAGITVIVGVSAYLLAVTQGASLILSEIMAIPYALALLITWVGYTSFTLYAGSRGVVITDTIMFVLFCLVIFIALPFMIKLAGSWNGAIQVLANLDARPDLLAWHGYNGPGARWANHWDSLAWALILGISWGLVVAVSPWQSSRYLMARDEHTVIRSGCMAAAAILFLYPALMMCGAAINLVNTDIHPSDSAMIWAALNMLPVLPGVLLLAGLMAAALSSASTFLSLIGFSAGNDILRLHGHSEQDRLRYSRVVMLVTGLVILLLGYFKPPSIMWITYFAGTLFASSWGPVAFMSVWSKKITSAGAFWGIVAGFLGNAVAKLLQTWNLIDLPVYLDPLVIGLILGIISIWTASFFTRPGTEEIAYLEQMHEMDRDETSSRDTVRTLLYPRLLVAGGIVLIIIMIMFYALPYNRFAVGQPAAGIVGPYMSGELILSVGYGSALILCGVISLFAVRYFFNGARGHE